MSPKALRSLRRILTADQDYRDEVLRRLMATPSAFPSAQLIAMADRDPVIRLRLLQAIRGVGSSTGDGD